MNEEQHGFGSSMSPHTVTTLGMVINALLAAGKIAAGLVCTSQAILADGLHSASDLVTDVAVLASLRVSDKPADSCHPYGHRRVATLAALFVGACLLGAAGWILYSAVFSLHERHGMGRRGVSTAVPLMLALVSIPLKEGLFRLTRWVGQRTENVALLANAWHHRSDAFSSIAAAAGLAGVAIGGSRWDFLDHLTAAVLAMFLLRAALHIIRDSAGELVDRAPSEAAMQRIEHAVRDTEGVRSHHAFRARKVGGKIIMDIHVQVDPELTVRQGHDIAENVHRRVLEADPSVVEAVIHIEPPEEPAADLTAVGMAEG